MIVVETAGETSEQADILELVHDTWLKAGIKLYTKPLQRETFRNRVFAGETLMSVWGGLENGAPAPASSPAELAPTSQQQLQWPKWGQHHQNRGRTGEPCDGRYATELLALYGSGSKRSRRGGGPRSGAGCSTSTRTRSTRSASWPRFRSRWW